MNTGMQPDMKISLVRREDAESPGSTRQNVDVCMVSSTCIARRAISVKYNGAAAQG